MKTQKAVEQHTAGPWKAKRNGSMEMLEVESATRLICFIYGPAKNEPVALQANGQPTPYAIAIAQAEANARLIAAAPEIIAELQMALVTLDTVWQERDPKNVAAKCCANRIRKVIAKATGGAL